MLSQFATDLGATHWDAILGAKGQEIFRSLPWVAERSSSLKAQRYDVKGILESGAELAVELERTGVLAKPVLNLPAGIEMKAFVAMFLTFRDGKIAEQRKHDCCPLLEAAGASTIA